MILGNTLGAKGMSMDDIKGMVNEKVKIEVAYGKDGVKIAQIIDWHIEGDRAKPIFDGSIAAQIADAPFIIKLDAKFDGGSMKDDEEEKQGDPWEAKDFVIENGTIVAIADSAKNKLKETNHVTIPSKDAKGNKITKIANNLFSRNADDPDDTKIKKLVIEDGIEEIGVAAFRNNLIEELVLPDSIKIIGSGAFSNNKQLGKLTLSNSLTKIDGAVFQACPITNLVVPEGVTEIGRFAFGSGDVINLTLPSTLKKIGSNAFSGNKNLQRLILPENVEEIENSAFDSCGLFNVTLNQGLKKIGKKAFAYNTIKSVTIPASVENLADNAFENNIDIKIIKEN